MATAEVLVNLERSNTKKKTEREEWGMTNLSKPTLTEETDNQGYVIAYLKGCLVFGNMRGENVYGGRGTE